MGNLISLTRDRPVRASGRRSMSLLSEYDFCIESLEERRLFIDYGDRTISLGLGLIGPNPIVSGTAVTLTASAQTEPPGLQAESGTFVWGWWGGAVLGSALGVPSPNIDYNGILSGQTSATLNEADAGYALKSGKYVGLHVLYVTYSGDGYWPPVDFGQSDIDYLEGAGSYAGGKDTVVTFVHPHTVAFVAPPHNAAAGDKLDPVQVAYLTDGTVDSSVTGNATIAMNTAVNSTGILHGTLSKPFVNGVATFKDLSIPSPGQYALFADDDAGDFTYSGLFNISGGKLVFKVAPPKTGTAGEPLNPAIVVDLLDGQNKLLTDVTGTVTLSPISIGANPTISGNTVDLVHGEATFSNLVLDKPDFYKLTASDSLGDADVTSKRFKVAGDHLVFKPQPTFANANIAFPVSVQILNADNKPDTAADSSIQLTMNIVKDGVNAVLTGTTLAQFASGLAAFTADNGPIINASGTYTLTATEMEFNSGVYIPSNTTTAITSKKFSVAGLHLLIKTQPPSTVTALEPIPMAVQIVDAKKHPVATENDAQVRLSITPEDPSNNGTIEGDFLATFVSGVANFPATAAAMINGVGKFTITATEVGTEDPASPVDTKKINVLGYQLKLVSQLGPFVADNPDVEGATGTPVNFGVFDSKGKPVKDITNLPDTSVTVLSSSENGVYKGEANSTASAFYSEQYAKQDISIPIDNRVDQANYGYTFRFSATGTYEVKIAPKSLDGAPPENNIVQPLTFKLSVGDPVLLDRSALTVQAGKSYDIRVTVDKIRSLAISDFFNVLQVDKAAGIALLVVDDSQKSAVTGTFSSAFTIHQGGFTGETQYSYDAADFQLAFAKPGNYLIAASEKMSPIGTTFDPATATPVSSTTPNLIKVHVIPDKAVVIQQPPANVVAGQPFSAAVSIEDAGGNVLTDLGTTELQYVGVVTATSLKGATTTISEPVVFVNGVATFDNLMLTTPSAYKLTITVSYYGETADFLNPTSLKAISKVFTISGG